MMAPVLRHSPAGLLLLFLVACKPSLPIDDLWKGHATIADGKTIPFLLDLHADPTTPSAGFIVGNERVPVPEVTINGDSIYLIVSEYNAAFRLRWDGLMLTGRYERYRSDTTGFSVSATPISTESADTLARSVASLSGSYTVIRTRETGVDSTNTAVFTARGDSVFGTIIAPSGDDGLLAGIQHGDTVRLARFTGWQSIYLEIVRDSIGWIGQRYVRALPPTSFRLRSMPHSDLAETPEKRTRLLPNLQRFSFFGITPEGDSLDQDNERFKNKALMIDIMGTWCHNCLDAAPLLQEIYETYRHRGLEIVSLAFELRDDLRSAKRNIEIFRSRHGITYPILFSGDLSAENVQRRLGSQLENFGAYPTTLFVDRSGNVIGIHKGFKGPGTGSGYQEEVERFHRMAEMLTQK